MNTTLEEAEALIRGMLPRLDAVRGVVRVLCPPFISLSLAQRLLQGTSVRLGAQNAYFEPRGAYSGEVSPTMLKGLCQYVILGHSERRLHFGESDDTINRKVRAAIEASLVPILCVGERLEENRSGKTEEVVARQLTQGLKEIPRPVELVIAYEPVWAIGTGIAATSKDANNTIGLVRRTLAGIYGSPFAEATPILYGGSVTRDNIAEFMAQSEVDGALVGGASLNAEGFVAIAEAAARRRVVP